MYYFELNFTYFFQPQIFHGIPMACRKPLFWVLYFPQISFFRFEIWRVYLQIVPYNTYSLIWNLLENWWFFIARILSENMENIEIFVSVASLHKPFYSRLLAETEIDDMIKKFNTKLKYYFNLSICTQLDLLFFSLFIFLIHYWLLDKTQIELQ